MFGGKLRKGKPIRYSRVGAIALIVTLILVAAFSCDAHAARVDPVIKAKTIARHLLYVRGWSSQYWALNRVIMSESSWHVDVWNRNCSAYARRTFNCSYGIPQALPANKMASMGKDWRTNPRTQLRWMLRYIEIRYGNPVNAYYFRVSRGYY